ncbi:unnamed protein product [Paramecium sonneborni]|uniref:Uncharacterized protein n=1 Tax=Paramecium sonneborni TaxID=65129 RepID=A0A8S1M1U8_9CILI|nr:unnamed protein product [Paramecium sonneborni]
MDQKECNIKGVSKNEMLIQESNNQKKFLKILFKSYELLFQVPEVYNLRNSSIVDLIESIN